MSDEDLVRIAQPGGQDAFLPDAVAAAQAELERRGVTEADVERIRDETAAERAQDAGRATEELSNGAWLGFLVLGLLFPMWFVLFSFHAQGYKTKVRQGLGAIVTGVGLFGLVAMVFALFDPARG